MHSDKNANKKIKMLLSNLIVTTNNRAKKQQDAGQLERYLLSTQINLTKEEVEEILRKYRLNNIK